MPETNTPDYSSDDFKEMIPIWKKVDDCLEGTEAMRKAGQEHLPQFPLEDDDVYRQRLEVSTFFPAYRDTIDGVTGTIFRKPTQLGKNVPLSIVADLENVDLAGTHFEVFGQRTFRAGLHYGAAFILVDMPQGPVPIGGVVDASQTRAVNFRPFWIMYGAKELANWPRYVVIDGAPVLQLIVFREESPILTAFGQECVTRFRVWRLPVMQLPDGEYIRTGNAEWEIWEEQAVGDGQNKITEIVRIDGAPSPLRNIPVAIFNTNACLENPRETEGPPFLDLANLNIKLYQQESDHEKNLHMCTPIPYTVNLKDDNEGQPSGMHTDFKWGTGVIFHCAEGGTVGYAEPSGTGLSERREWMTGIKQQMLDMGMAIAQEGSNKGGSMTAKEAMLKEGTRASRLTQWARAYQDCIEVALGFTAQWKGEPSGGEIVMGVKDADLILSAQDMTAISSMVEKHQHSLKYMWLTEARGGFRPDGYDEEQELADIQQDIERAQANMPELIPVLPGQPMAKNGMIPGGTA